MLTIKPNGPDSSEVVMLLKNDSSNFQLWTVHPFFIHFIGFQIQN